MTMVRSSSSSILSSSQAALTLALSLGLVASTLHASEHATASESNWPHWRGPHAHGSVQSGSYPTEWSVGDVEWKVALPGKGSSTPIVYNDTIYLTAPAEGQDVVMALGLDGKTQWKTEVGGATPPKHQKLGSSCNSSPVTDGTGLFVYFKSGHFAALELDGTVRWQKNLNELFGEENLFWDQGSSPVLTEKHVILTRLHAGESWVAGFDKTTGEMSWKQDRTFKAPPENDNGYATPVFFDQNGTSAFLVWASDKLTAHQASNGELLWTCGQFNPSNTGYWPAIATPVVVNDIAVVATGRDDRRGQAGLHGIKLGGKDDVTATHRVWKRDDVGVFVTSPVVYKDQVYLLRHRGEIVCIDPTTGKTVWDAALPRSAASYFASPTIANGVLYAAREDGTVFAARVDGEFELLSENAMGESIIASPIAVAGRLLLRGENHLFSIRAL